MSRVVAWSLLAIAVACGGEPPPASATTSAASTVMPAGSSTSVSPEPPTGPATARRPARPPEPAVPQLRPPPPGLADLREAVPAARFAIGYATADNFTAAPLPGYGAPGAWAHPALAAALAEVDAVLLREGLGLLIYDAYRPRRATAAMVAWARRSGRTDLLDDGYIAARSQHNRGLAIDVTLVERPTGTPLAMGTAWDTFSRDSATFAVQGEARRNRERLRAAMIAVGLRPHDGEWWHFALPHADAPVLDVAYAP
ncbi:MAG: hypothetical protein KBB21_33905 [Nannocystaceae bacterium]|nr:hypothetical protein [Deltaproteobacteria bacterium]MBP7291674.1 hypothetical protein [Nannocystaceae bacterium]